MYSGARTPAAREKRLREAVCGDAPFREHLRVHYQTDPEVRESGPGSTRLGIGVDQDVGGLDVFVEHTDGVGRTECHRGLRHQLEPLL